MKATWNAAAEGYATNVIELWHDMFAEFAAHVVPALSGLEGPDAPRILDIASASGEPAATLARALPQAAVLSTDLAEPYLVLGRARAARLGLTNVSFQTADATDLRQFGDAEFDAVTCSLGLMFVPDVGAALAEFKRVLKPGGVLAVTVWKSLELVPFFKVNTELAAGGGRCCQSGWPAFPIPSPLLDPSQAPTLTPPPAQCTTPPPPALSPLLCVSGTPRTCWPHWRHRGLQAFSAAGCSSTL